MNKTAINMPKSSPAILVNLLIIVQALNMASKNSNSAVQTQTLHSQINVWNLGESKWTKSWKMRLSALPSCPSQEEFTSQILPSFGKVVQICVHNHCRFCNSQNQKRLTSKYRVYYTTNSSRSQSFHRAQTSIYNKNDITFRLINKPEKKNHYLEDKKA